MTNISENFFHKTQFTGYDYVHCSTINYAVNTLNVKIFGTGNT